ncbi:MAG: major facilitator transporter [Frankiales bacterium]|nr:major facilitator transporter [Frankiales bacterium]
MVGAIWWPAVFHAASIPSRIGPPGTRVSALGSTGDCPCCWPHPGTCPRPGAGQPDDLGGAFSSTAGMTALVYGIVRAADAGWSDPLTVASLAVGITLLACSW